MELARYRPLGFYQLTATGTAQTFSAASVSSTVLGAATHVLLRSETQGVRWRDDGTAPTASVGNLISTTDQPFLYGGNPNAFQFIQQTSGAVLDASFYQAVG